MKGEEGLGGGREGRGGRNERRGGNLEEGGREGGRKERSRNLGLILNLNASSKKVTCTYV